MNINVDMIKILITKEWSLYKSVICAYLAACVAGLGILLVPHEWAFYISSIILMTVLIAAGVHGIMVTIIGEKKDQTVPFIMSLPITPADFAIAKIASNLFMFALPWLAIVFGLVGVLSLTAMPLGLLPLCLLVSTLIFLNYCIILCVAMLTESEGWSILATVLVNFSLNPFIIWVTAKPEIAENFQANQAVWDSTVLTLISFLVVLIIAILLATIAVRATKKVFI